MSQLVDLKVTDADRAAVQEELRERPPCMVPGLFKAVAEMTEQRSPVKQENLKHSDQQSRIAQRKESARIALQELTMVMSSVRERPKGALPNEVGVQLSWQCADDQKQTGAETSSIRAFATPSSAESFQVVATERTKMLQLPFPLTFSCVESEDVSDSDKSENTEYSVRTVMEWKFKCCPESSIADRQTLVDKWNAVVQEFVDKNSGDGDPSDLPFLINFRLTNSQDGAPQIVATVATRELDPFSEAMQAQLESLKLFREAHVTVLLPMTAADWIRSDVPLPMVMDGAKARAAITSNRADAELLLRQMAKLFSKPANSGGFDEDEAHALPSMVANAIGTTMASGGDITVSTNPMSQCVARLFKLGTETFKTKATGIKPQVLNGDEEVARSFFTTTAAETSVARQLSNELILWITGRNAKVLITTMLAKEYSKSAGEGSEDDSSTDELSRHVPALLSCRGVVDSLDEITFVSPVFQVDVSVNGANPFVEFPCSFAEMSSVIRRAILRTRSIVSEERKRFEAADSTESEATDENDLDFEELYDDAVRCAAARNAENAFWSAFGFECDRIPSDVETFQPSAVTQIVVCCKSAESHAELVNHVGEGLVCDVPASRSRRFVGAQDVVRSVTEEFDVAESAMAGFRVMHNSIPFKIWIAPDLDQSAAVIKSASCIVLLPEVNFDPSLLEKGRVKVIVTIGTSNFPKPSDCNASVLSFPLRSSLSTILDAVTSHVEPLRGTIPIEF